MNGQKDILGIWISENESASFCRHNNQATIVASQYEPAEWLAHIPIPVAAEAITDRLSAQAYKIIIKRQ